MRAKPAQAGVIRFLESGAKALPQTTFQCRRKFADSTTGKMHCDAAWSRPQATHLVETKASKISRRLHVISPGREVPASPLSLGSYSVYFFRISSSNGPQNRIILVIGAQSGPCEILKKTSGAISGIGQPLQQLRIIVLRDEKFHQAICLSVGLHFTNVQPNMATFLATPI